MKSKQLIEVLKSHLTSTNYDFQYDHEKDQLRIEHRQLKKGIDLSLQQLQTKYKTKKEVAIEEVVHLINATFRAMEHEEKIGFTGEEQVFPVIRSTSFAKKTAAGQAFITKAHTAETVVYYALDLGETYRLIDEGMLESLGKTASEIQEMALFNVRKLSTKMKQDEVAGNIFYFVNNNDGYDASRILNDGFLKDMASKIEGDMTVSVPHQDVLIIGDIRNKTGYDVLAQMTMQFFTNGIVPVTSLSFVYEEGQLEPIFIMAKNRTAKKKGQDEK